MSKFLDYRIVTFITMTALTGCSLAPDFKLPDTHTPDSFKEKAQSEMPDAAWQEAKPLAKEDRGQWWKIFGDDALSDLEKQAQDANQDLKAAAARVIEARQTAETNSPSILPDLDIGANAARVQTPGASLAAFGEPSKILRPYNLYSAQGTLSYEADLFGSIRDNYKASDIGNFAWSGPLFTTLHP